MLKKTYSLKTIILSTISVLALYGCGGGGGGSSSTAQNPPPVSQPPAPTSSDSVFVTEKETSRFFSRATFGAKSGDIANWTDRNASDWIQAEFDKPATLMLPVVQNYQSQITDLNERFNKDTTSFAFWKNAISCLLYTSPSPRDQRGSRMPSSA